MATSDQQKRASSAYYRRNTEKLKQLSKEWRSANLHRVAIARLRKIGVDVTLEWFEQAFLAQDGKCAICRTAPAPGKRRLNIDHDHETMKPRGLLCGTCNRGIGLLRDSPVLLGRALVYLQGG